MATLAFVGGPSMAAEAPAKQPLTCNFGPVSKQYGGTTWLAYSCVDKKTLVFVTAPGSPAMPFVFILTPSDRGHELYGEGTGDKRLTDAAYAELKVIADPQIAALLAETQAKGQEKRD